MSLVGFKTMSVPRYFKRHLLRSLYHLEGRRRSATNQKTECLLPAVNLSIVGSSSFLSALEIWNLLHLSIVGSSSFLSPLEIWNPLHLSIVGSSSFLSPLEIWNPLHLSIVGSSSFLSPLEIWNPLHLSIVGSSSSVIVGSSSFLSPPWRSGTCCVKTCKRVVVFLFSFCTSACTKARASQEKKSS